MNKRVYFYSSVREKSDFLTSSFYQIDIKILQEEGFKVTPTNKVRDFLLFWKYDLTFIYFYRKGLLAAFLSWLFCKKVFFTGGIDALCPEYATSKQLIVQRMLFRLCYFFATKCIIVSNSDRDNISLFFKYKQKLAVVPHAIYMDEYMPNRCKENIISTICWMGSASNALRKGVDNLIRGFVVFKEKHPDYLLYIVGRSGPGEAYLRSIADECGISDSIVFTGSVSNSEKLDILSRSKYYGQLSLFEGFGVAALEALASGCIVIHTGRGGLRDSIGEYGLLVYDANNISEIVGKLEECETNAAKYSLVVRKGVDYARATYDYSGRQAAIKGILD